MRALVIAVATGVIVLPGCGSDAVRSMSDSTARAASGLSSAVVATSSPSIASTTSTTSTTSHESTSASAAPVGDPCPQTEAGSGEPVMVALDPATGAPCFILRREELPSGMYPLALVDGVLIVWEERFTGSELAYAAVAIRLADGSEVWRTAVGDFGLMRVLDRFLPWGTARGVLGVVLPDGRLAGLDTATGAIRWSGPTGLAHLYDSPETVVAGSDAGLVAFDRATGEQRWQGSPPGSTLVVDETGRSYLAGSEPDDELILTSAIDLATGQPADLPPVDDTTTWRTWASWYTSERSSAVPQVGAMHFTSNDVMRTVYGFAGDTQRWSTFGPATGLSAPVIAGEGVVVARDAAGYETFHALDAATGDHRWSADVATMPFINQERWMVSDGLLVVAGSTTSS